MTEAQIAAELKKLRTLTQADVDRRAEGHAPVVRYKQRQDRHAPAAH